MLLVLTDHQIHLLIFGAVAFLAFFLFMSMIPLRRSEEELQRKKQKLEDQIVAQQNQLLHERSSSAAWRLEMQREFDAYRANASKQLTDAEQRTAVVQQHLDATLKQAWKTETELRQSLDRALQLIAANGQGMTGNGTKAATGNLTPERKDTGTTVVSNGEVETLRVDLAASEQRAAALQQSLSIERRRSRIVLARAKKNA